MGQTSHRPDYFLPGLAVGTLLGGVIGGLTALWFTPQSGKQLQTLMHKQGKALKHQAGEVTAHLYGQIEDSTAQAVEQVATLRQDGEQLLNDQVERINAAASSVKKSVSK
jgi:gas vesicle protein